MIVKVPGDAAPLLFLRNDQAPQQTDSRLFRIAKLRGFDSRGSDALGALLRVLRHRRIGSKASIRMTAARG